MAGAAAFFVAFFAAFFAGFFATAAFFTAFFATFLAAFFAAFFLGTCKSSFQESSRDRHDRWSTGLSRSARRATQSNPFDLSTLTSRVSDSPVTISCVTHRGSNSLTLT